MKNNWLLPVVLPMLLVSVWKWHVCCDELSAETDRRIFNMQKRSEANDQLIQLESRLIPEPPVINVKLRHDKQFSDTTIDDVNVKIIGKPRLHQFFSDRSYGWIVRCEITAKDKSKPICGISNIVRGADGRVDHDKLKIRDFQFGVETHSEWEFVHVDDRNAGFTWRTNRFVDQLSGSDDQIKVCVRPNFLEIDEKYTNGEFVGVEDETLLILDLLFKKAAK